MAKKSAAELKVVKNEEPAAAAPTLEERWENEYMAVEMLYIDTQIEQAKRIDTLVELRAASKEFFGDHLPIDVLKAIQEDAVETYRKVREVIMSYDLEEFKKDEIEDPFKDIIKKGADVDDDMQLFCEFLTFRFVKPFAERAIRLHKIILDEVEKDGGPVE